MSLAADNLIQDQFDSKPIDFLYAKDNGLLLTTEEFDAIDDAEEGYRYELIRGVLVVSPAPSSSERSIVGELLHLVLTYRDTHPHGRCIANCLYEHDILIGPDRRRADLVIWVSPPEGFSARTTTPTIIVEVVSPGSRNRRRDFIDKRDAYMSLDVREYWVFDRVKRTLTIFSRQDKGIGERLLSATETYTTPLMPGFDVPLGSLFATVNKLQSEG